jgi:tetratricopeptide (TPR) repeat protein
MQGVLEGSGKYGQYAELLNKETLSPLLNDAQQKLWDAPEDSTAAIFIEQLETLRTKFTETSPDYFNAVQKNKEQEEESMRKAEKEAEEERKANGEDDEDHDRRKLKSADRMRLVQRNKDEATELFKGKNFAHAAARYTKALGHCSKFVDMTPEVKQQVQDMKVTLYLNLAQCYLKLEAWTKVVPNCKDALSFDENNPKALYRRAYALVKLKKIDDANKDVKLALKTKPDDKSLLKLKKVIDAHIKKAKAKERKMAKAMFG